MEADYMSEVIAENVVSLSEETKGPSKEDVFNYLIAIGANSCSRGYDESQKEMRKLFLNMPLKDIAPTWVHLNDQVKIAVINAHADEFNQWIQSS